MSWYSVEYLLVFIAFTSFGLIRDVHGHFCPKDWVYRPESNSCYLITTMVRRPWLEAQLACEANEGYLLKIDDEDERNWILTQIGKVQSTDSLRTSEWWLGLNDRKKELKWVWTDGTPIAENAIVWNDHEPNNWGGAEWCAEIWGHGLNDKSCSIVQAYICERPKNYPFKCDNDRGWEYYNGTCYKYFSETMSWYNAQFTCEMEDSELVTIEDRTEQFYVNDQAMKYLKSVWIGLRYIEDEKQGAYEWQWINGKQVSINFWNEGRFPIIKEELKNNTCAFADPYIQTVNIWLSGQCHLLKPFLCQKKTGTCVDGWVQHQDSCYQFSFLYRMTYTKAKGYCEAQGGYLTDINSARDQDFINSKLKELSDAGIERFWIGLTVDMEGRPEWDTTENVTFTNWPLRGIPRKSHIARCVHIKTNDVEGKWIIDYSCSQPRAFVCKIATGVKVKDVARPDEHYSCAPGWFAMSKYCFKFFSETLTWPAAKIACQKHNAHLIKASSSTAQSVLRIPTTIRGKYVWIGLNDRAKEGKMVWENDGTELDPVFARWLPGEPDNVESHENCVASSITQASGYWSDFDCQRSFPFVCQRLADNMPGAKNTTTIKPSPVNPACGAEWESDPTGKTCYHFSDEQLTWFDAQLSCSYHGGYLTSITGLHEQFYIAGRIQNMQSATLWIGAHDLNEEGLWLWSDKSPMSYFNWKTGHPDYDRVKNNCAMVGRDDSLWVDNICYLRSGYICKKAALPEPTTTVTPPTPPPDDSEFSCPNTWVFYNGACYKVITELYSWEYSLKNCHLQGGNLVSINSRSEQSFIQKLVTNAKPSKIFWIGLTDAHHEGIYTWSNGDKVVYTNWNAWEPNNFLTENCVLYSSSEKRWSDYKCNSKEGSICKKEADHITTGNCLSNIQSDSLCFLHVMIPKNWHDAWTYCRHKLNGDLATIDNYEKQQSANQGILSHGPPYWISPESSKGSFQNWKDDKEGDLTNTKCLAIESGSMKKWIRVSCLSAAYFICARSLDATKNTTLSPPVTSSGHPATTTTMSTIPTAETNINVTCPEDWKLFRNSCYKEFYTNLHGLKWIDALHSCQEHSTLLVSLESDEELMFLRTNVMKKNNNPYWLGGRFTESGNITWLNSKYEVNVDHGLIPFSFHSLCPVISKWQPNIYSLHCDQAADWICKMTPRSRKEKVNKENLDTYCKTGSLLQGPYYNGSCYVSAFEFKKVTWHKSKTVCELYNKRIASIHSQDENDYLAMAFSARRFLWIGIHTYSMVHDNKWADGSAIDYTNWDEGEPKDIYKNPCTVLDTVSGKWRTLNCYALFPALCKGQDSYEISDKHHETILTGGCLPGFVLFGNKCFMIGGTGYREQLSWQAAQEKCHSYGKLYGLASIQTRFEQAFLTLMMKSLNISLWIGMRKGIDYLTWVDNSPLSFFHFSTLAVEELLRYSGTSCIATHTEPYSAGLWFGSNCYELAGYICQGYRDANLPLVKKAEVVSELGYKKYGNAEYKVVKMNKTWTEAEAFCQKDGAHVASIADAFENAALRLISKDIQEEFWIGARKHDKQMAWSDSWPMRYTRWPVIMSQEDECGLYQAQDVWNMVECNKQYPFICKITTEKPPKVAETPTQMGKCPEDWLHIKNKCYLVKSTLRSWPDANYVCAQIGATLTSLHSADDITSINDIRISLALLPSNSIWIGLSLKAGVLSWSDNSNVDFFNFMHGETADEGHASYFSEHNISRNCFVMDFQTALWRRVSCFEKFSFLCMTDQVLPTTTNNSGVCLNCTTGTPEAVKPAVTTVEIVAICLVVPVLLVVLALIPYYIIKRKTEAASPETESFLNSLYESPNFMVMNPS